MCNVIYPSICKVYKLGCPLLKQLEQNLDLILVLSSIFLSCLVLTDRPPPIIRQGPANQTLGVDTLALLRCHASGEPVPTISWLKDGVSLLGKDPRMSLQDLGSLQIKSLRVNLNTFCFYCFVFSFFYESKMIQ